MKNAVLKGVAIARELLDKVENKLGKQEKLEVSPQKEENAPLNVEQCADPNISTFEDRVPMNDLLRAWSRTSGHTVKELKAKVRIYTEVVRIDFMTKEQVKDVCVWIEQQIKSAKVSGKSINKNSNIEARTEGKK